MKSPPIHLALASQGFGGNFCHCSLFNFPSIKLRPDKHNILLKLACLSFSLSECLSCSICVYLSPSISIKHLKHTHAHTLFSLSLYLFLKISKSNYSHFILYLYFKNCQFSFSCSYLS